MMNLKGVMWGLIFSIPLWIVGGETVVLWQTMSLRPSISASDRLTIKLNTPATLSDGTAETPPVIGKAESGHLVQVSTTVTPKDGTAQAANVLYVFDQDDQFIGIVQPAK